MSTGTHLITLSVTDDLETVSTTKTIIVKSSLIPSISSPSTDSTFSENNNINFIGSATNTFGSYTCTWSSSIDGSLGSGCNINSSSLSTGTHLITLSVTDDLETVTNTKNIIVSPPPELPYIMYNSAKLYIHPTNSANVVWGPNTTVTTGATSTTNGASNTNIIVAAYGTSTSYAARICYDLVDSYVGYDDWYLPAIDQLSAIYTGNDNILKGDFAGSWVDLTNYYWASTEYTTTHAYAFGRYGQSNAYKYYSDNVRCVRDP